jgi:hypothetical protein
MSHLLLKCRELIPSIDASEIIHSFAGVRAKNSTGDWIVRPSEKDPSFVHAAGYHILNFEFFSPSFVFL